MVAEEREVSQEPKRSFVRGIAGFSSLTAIDGEHNHIFKSPKDALKAAGFDRHGGSGLEHDLSRFGRYAVGLGSDPKLQDWIKSFIENSQYLSQIKFPQALKDFVTWRISYDQAIAFIPPEPPSREVHSSRPTNEEIRRIETALSPTPTVSEPITIFEEPVAILKKKDKKKQKGKKEKDRSQVLPGPIATGINIDGMGKRLVLPPHLRTK